MIAHMANLLGTIAKFGVSEVQTFKGAVETLWRHLKKCPHAPLTVKEKADMKLSRGSSSGSSAASPAQSATHQDPRHPALHLPPVPPIPQNSSDVIPPLAPTPIASANTSCFYGEAEPRPMPSAILSEFHADLCWLMVSALVSWRAVELPYWQYFFQKWVPGAVLPSREVISGRILNEEVAKADLEMRKKVQSHYGTGQCDGWKNVAKSSLITGMINIEYQVSVLPALLSHFRFSRID